MIDIPSHSESGELRRVGVEIEFAELSIEQAAESIVAVFGGSIQKITDYEIEVRNEDTGRFRVEVDFALLKRLGQERNETDQPPGIFEQLSEDALAALARQVSPCEIVSPPLPFEQIAQLDELVGQLRRAGAKGTEAALRYAFGLHFNPQAPSLQADSLLAHMRAFVLLYDWLQEQLKIDISRRLSPFIDGFPGSYVKFILADSYYPDLDRLVDDYLNFNPTRNRALDMLPLLTHVDAGRVYTRLDDPLIRARPTYHYRLSDSRVGDPGWLISDEWRYWLIIEQLAQNRPLITAMAADYLQLADSPLHLLTTRWRKRTAQWLDESNIL